MKNKFTNITDDIKSLFTKTDTDENEGSFIDDGRSNNNVAKHIVLKEETLEYLNKNIGHKKAAEIGEPLVRKYAMQKNNNQELGYDFQDVDVAFSPKDESIVPKHDISGENLLFDKEFDTLKIHRIKEVTANRDKKNALHHSLNMHAKSVSHKSRIAAKKNVSGSMGKK